MARVRYRPNGKLGEAMATLLEAQAFSDRVHMACLAKQAESGRETAEYWRESERLERATGECFARIEALLAEQDQLLRALPDAILAKIGFMILDEASGAQ